MRWRPLGRTWWLAAASAVAAAFGAGFLLLIAFLARQTLSDADQWASVGAVVVAYLAFAGGVLVWVLRHARGSRSPAVSDVPRHGGGLSGHLAGPPRELATVRQLPASSAAIFGREQAVADALDGREEYGLKILNIHGLPGVGKTTLAVRIAHELDSPFADCQMYFDLRDSSVEDLLGSALIALGMQPSELPPGEDLRAGHFRSLLPDRAVIVIENANAQQSIVNLLPGSGNHFVIVTSWDPLNDLPNARLIALQPLSAPDSVELLRAVSGRSGGTDSDLAAVAKLAGHLPLALHICAGLVRANTHWSWHMLEEKLSDQAGEVRIGKLEKASVLLRRSLDLAYSNLDAGAARAYRLLGLSPASDMSTGLVLALVAPERQEAEDLLDSLTSRQLLRLDDDRCHMHNVLWAKARDLVADEDPLVRADATNRLIAWSMRELGATYRQRLHESVAMTPVISHNVVRQVRLSDVYIKTHVRQGKDFFELSDLFPRKSAVLIGAGGTGKTTMVNYLCWTATRDGSPDPLPLVIYARDLDPAAELPAFGKLMSRTLRHRYRMEIPEDAIAVAMDQRLVSVIVDGLDEIINETFRRSVTDLIRQLASRYPGLPTLITTRPSADVYRDFTSVSVLHVGDWDGNVAADYADKLTRATDNEYPIRLDAETARRLVSQPDLRDAVGAPLLSQIAATLGELYETVPAGVAPMLEMVIDGMLLERELRRLRIRSIDVLREIEYLAFTMQCSTADRTTISEDTVMLAMKTRPTTEDTHRPAQTEDRTTLNQYMFYILEVLGHRGTLLIVARDSKGKPRYAFTHTAYREFLAASYLSRQRVPEIARAIDQYKTDLAWDSVLHIAIDIAIRRNEDFGQELLAEAKENFGEPVHRKIAGLLADRLSPPRTTFF